MTRPSPITIDDEVVSLARRYRREAVASLVTVLRDESAPASARAQASAKLLEYSDGKPGQARQISVADLQSMPDDLRQQLLEALLNHYQPDGYRLFVEQTMQQCIDDAMAQASLPKPNRFKRGPLAGKGPEVPRWPPAPRAERVAEPGAALEPPADALSAAYSATPRASPAQPPAAAESALYAPLIASRPPDDPPARRLASEPPDRTNVVVMPGVGTPYGLKYGMAENLENTNDTASGNGRIPPDVVRRSALKDPLDPWRRS